MVPPHAPSVDVDGPLRATVVWWRQGSTSNATLVVKSLWVFGEAGVMSPVAPSELTPDERIPSLPSAEILCYVGATPPRATQVAVGFTLSRGDVVLLERRVDPSAPLAPQLGPLVDRVAPQGPDGVVEIPPGLPRGALHRAHPAQRCGFLTGGETITFHHLDPAWPRFAQTLPRLSLRVNASVAGVTADLRGEVLTVDLPGRRCSLVWRADVRGPSTPDTRWRVQLRLDAANAHVRPPDPPIVRDARPAAARTAFMGEDVRDAIRKALPFSPVISAKPDAAPSSQRLVAPRSTLPMSMSEQELAALRNATPFHLHAQTPAPTPSYAGPASSAGATQSIAREPGHVWPFGAAAQPAGPVIAPLHDEGPAPAGIALASFAAICADLEAPSARRADVLGARGVSEAQWEEAQAHWDARMEDESDAGEAHVLRFDDAYVARWEQLGVGRFGVDELAKLERAERGGSVLGVVDQLGLPLSLVLRLRRVWQRRVDASPQLRSELQALLRGGT